jgi:hypothetical protein
MAPRVPMPSVLDASPVLGTPFNPEIHVAWPYGFAVSVGD